MSEHVLSDPNKGKIRDLCRTEVMDTRHTLTRQQTISEILNGHEALKRDHVRTEVVDTRPKLSHMALPSEFMDNRHPLSLERGTVENNMWGAARVRNELEEQRQRLTVDMAALEKQKGTLHSRRTELERETEGQRRHTAAVLLKLEGQREDE